MKPVREGKETEFEVRTFDAKMSPDEYRSLPKNPLYFILDNLRSAFNVGSIFRIGDILRIQGLLLCGCTAAPPNQRLRKTSMGTVDYVQWRYFQKTIDAVDHLHETGVAVWAAETTSASKRYNGLAYPKNVAIVLGNEALGVSKEVLKVCDEIIEIPIFGYKNSLNVAAACAVIGFKALELWGNDQERSA
jgi:tRNA G18 (ribose-2'-O)-methylase SpoU